MSIRLLPPTLVNRIAAGEVVERPAAAMKELVENAIDAGADRVAVTLVEGGQALIKVVDDGIGMSAADLDLAVERHATSKLPDDDLSHIGAFGFRGEALPSIGAVARLSLISRIRDGEAAWRLLVEGGRKGAVEPAAHPPGTTVEVRDLFFATPARLKFLKSPRTEFAHARDALERLAMAHPFIAFSLFDGDRRALLLPACAGAPDQARTARLTALLGTGFAEAAIPVAAAREGVALSGLIGRPVFSKATGAAQFLFVNGRPVRDRLFAGAVRAGYADVMAHDRHPVVALFLSIEPELVDVNVHPAKAEVRFRDPGLVRGLIVAALRHALAEAGGHVHSPLLAAAVHGMAGSAGRPDGGYQPRLLPSWGTPRPSAAALGLARDAGAPLGMSEGGGDATAADMAPGEPDFPPLGLARAQLHDTYILAETREGVVLVDQHAAHERIVYERLKDALAQGGVARQGLLLPEVVEMAEPLCRVLVERESELERMGLCLEGFGPGAVMVREIPALLKGADIPALVRDLAEQAAEWGEASALDDRIAFVLKTLACHTSVRAGRRLSLAEMDALLRAMEDVPRASQCNHGRPTYVTLAIGEIERLFGRR